jgi:hypothetical protein
MENGLKVLACTETEVITIVCRLSAFSVDRSPLSPIRKGKCMFLLHARQAGGRKIVRQQRSPVLVSPAITGQNFKDEVSMASEKGLQQSERVFLLLREQHPVILPAISLFHHDLLFSSLFATQPLTADSA